jgi:tetratricopeptide (TPR) repeat protein
MIPGRLKYIFALLILFTYQVLVYGQKVQPLENSVDSLKTLLATKNGSERLNILSGLFEHYKGSEYKVALDYAVEFETLAKNYGDSVKIVEGARKVGYSLMDLGRNVEAIGVLEQALSIAERNKERLPGMKKHIKFILNNAGIAYTDIGNYKMAFELLFRSLAIRQEEGDQKLIAGALNNIGRLYHDLRNPIKAIEYYQGALEEKAKTGDKQGIERIQTNLGLCYDIINEHEKALTYFNKALKQCGEDCLDETKRELYLAIGRNRLLVHKLDTAEDYLRRALDISIKQSNSLYTINCLFQLSFVEAERGNIEKRKSYLEQALALAGSVDFTDMKIQINGELIKLYGEMKDRSMQAYYLSKYTKLKDSIYSDELIKNLAKVKTSLAEREDIKTVKTQGDKPEPRLRVINQQRSQVVFIVVVTLLSLCLSLLLFRANRKQAQAIDIIANNASKHK